MEVIVIVINNFFIVHVIATTAVNSELDIASIIGV